LPYRIVLAQGWLGGSGLAIQFLLIRDLFFLSS
jgi:hypothetical protein